MKSELVCRMAIPTARYCNSEFDRLSGWAVGLENSPSVEGYGQDFTPVKTDGIEHACDQQMVTPAMQQSVSIDINADCGDFIIMNTQVGFNNQKPATPKAKQFGVEE